MPSHAVYSIYLTITLNGKTLLHFSQLNLYQEKKKEPTGEEQVITAESGDYLIK